MALVQDTKRVIVPDLTTSTASLIPVLSAPVVGKLMCPHPWGLNAYLILDLLMHDDCAVTDTHRADGKIIVRFPPSAPMVRVVVDIVSSRHHHTRHTPPPVSHFDYQPVPFVPPPTVLPSPSPSPPPPPPAVDESDNPWSLRAHVAL